MKLAILALLAAVVAAPAAAGTYYISDSPTTAWGANTDADHPGSLSDMNANVAAGDVVYVLPGNYAGDIDPVESGTRFSRISIQGDISDPSTATFSGRLYFGNQGTNIHLERVCITVEGITLAGEINLESAAYGDTSLGETCAYDSILYCVSRSGLHTRTMHDCAIQHCTIGDGIGAGTDEVSISSDLGGDTYDCDISYNTFNLANNSVVGQKKIFVFFAPSNIHPAYWNRDITFSHNRVFMTGTGDGGTGAGADCHFRLLYWTRTCTFSDNYWYCLNNGINAQIAMRDSSMANTFLRDTIYIDPVGTEDTKLLQTSSGTYPGSPNHNTFIDCVYNNGRGISKLQSTSHGDLYSGCTMVNRLYASYDMDDQPSQFSDYWDSLTFNHCTFVGHGPAGLNYADNTLKVRSCVFYNYDSGAELKVPSGADPESTLFFSPNGSPSTAYQTWDGSALTTATIPATCAWGDPVFIDSTYAGFDARPSICGAAVSNFWADGYCGARTPFPKPCGFKWEPPSQPWNPTFSVNGNPYLYWKANGEDEYELLHSATGPITDDNADKAEVLATGSLSTMGTLDSLQVYPRGGHVHWYVLRTKLTGGDWGPIIGNTATNSRGGGD